MSMRPFLHELSFRKNELTFQEKMMVEVSERAGYWPSIYGPIRNISKKVADWFAPSSEASSMDDFYEISIELPGVKSDDIDLQLEDGRLSVKGEKKSEREQKGRSYYFSEREYGLFQRNFRLPQDADSENISAEFKDGVLSLKIGKQTKKKPEGKKISIKSG